MIMIFMYPGVYFLETCDISRQYSMHTPLGMALQELSDAPLLLSVLQSVCVCSDHKFVQL